ncbi:MAG: thiol peroxidase [Gammaproteobacteria bacterium]|nr:thiol peroxidase [Gammaproteobacteria bacterium]
MDIKEITRDELVQLQNSGKKFKLVDVLDRESYAREHLPNAISMPLDDLKKMADKFLSKEELIIVYCASFKCPASTAAAKVLNIMGFKNILNYKGGLQDYKEGNFSLVGALHTKAQNLKKVTMQGKELSLVGRKISVGKNAAKFSVVDNNFADVTLDKFKGKIKIITSFVSLDTPVCDLQVKQFNKKASELSANVVIIGMSKDLPFAQKRFCAANDIKNIAILSDFKSSSFGINYGLLIKENNLLARATIILDSNDVIRFIDIVDEITNEPDYAEVLRNLTEVINSPAMPVAEGGPAKCIPCKAGTPPLEKNKIDTLIPRIINWELVDNKKLVKEFQFRDFVEAKYFLDLLAVIAEEQGHHPNFSLIYNKLKVTLTTHVAGGLTDNDFIMARIIDEVSA